MSRAFTAFIKLCDSTLQMPASTAPPYYKGICRGIALYFEQWQLLCYILYLECTCSHHLGVVCTFGRYNSGIVITFQTAYTMFETLCGRYCPISDFCLLIAREPVKVIFQAFGGIMRLYFGHIRQFRQFPQRRSVTDKGIGKQDDGRKIFQRYLRRHISIVEAVVGRRCRHYH